MLRTQGLKEEIGSATEQEKERKRDWRREEMLQNNHLGEWERNRLEKHIARQHDSSDHFSRSVVSNS